MPVNAGLPLRRFVESSSRSELHPYRELALSDYLLACGVLANKSHVVSIRARGVAL